METVSQVKDVKINSKNQTISTLEKLKEKIVKEKGWFVPEIHGKYLRLEKVHMKNIEAVIPDI